MRPVAGSLSGRSPELVATAAPTGRGVLLMCVRACHEVIARQNLSDLSWKNSFSEFSENSIHLW